MINIIKQAQEIWHSLRRFKKRVMKEYTYSQYVTRKKYKKAFLSLKDIHKGKRCFIIGNGPSLTPHDLNLIKEEYSFGTNRIYYMFDKTEWRPTYYCAQDMNVLEDIGDDIGFVQKNCRKMFIICDRKKYLRDEVIKNPNTLFFCTKYVDAHKKRLFSENISKYISGGGTITYTAIQIAVYMGFSEIYLLGCDHSYSAASFKEGQLNSEDVKASYFEGMPTNIKITKPGTDNSTISYLAALNYCKLHNITIKNATRGGKLEVFERITLEEILNS